MNSRAKRPGGRWNARNAGFGTPLRFMEPSSVFLECIGTMNRSVGHHLFGVPASAGPRRSSRLKAGLQTDEVFTESPLARQLPTSGCLIPFQSRTLASLSQWGAFPKAFSVDRT